MMSAMATAAARRSDEPKRDVQLGVRVTLEQNEILQSLADTKFNGSRSWAIAYLVDVHAGKEIERAMLDEQQLAQPIEIVKWKSSRLTAEVVGYVAGLIRAGNRLENACNLAGITERQRNAWMKKGRNDQREGKQSVHADFLAAVLRAEAECEAEDIAQMREHGKRSYQALAWRLERQNPRVYAQRKVIDGKMQHSLTPMVDYDRFTTSELKTFVYLLRKGSPSHDDPHVARDRPPAIDTVPEEVIEIVDAEWTEAPALEAGPRADAIEPKLEQAAAGAAEAPGLEDPEAPGLEKPRS